MSLYLHDALERRIGGKKVEEIRVGQGIITLIFEGGIEVTFGKFRQENLEFKIEYYEKKKVEFTVPKDY
ncbi:hypothetical protein DCC39_10325 [Pueribacillus theae]|uniref:Uncharacterized protein n=1 Tax=Pueribacillus theae TaxID=2171751 RepID=A0A2U1K1F7_9BACI|nr:hypothetical protein [Pueribacillus theae]PWA11085.1 hypothetical protein DCC39_10325 [Pueribacillus theae]